MNRQDNLVNRILELVAERLPEGVAGLGQDVRQHLAVAVKESLGRMDLVTREEFEIQARVLARTRQRLEQLEQQLRLLETQLPQDGQITGHPQENPRQHG